MNFLWLTAALLTPTFWAISNVLDSALRKHFIKDDLIITWLGGLMKLPFALLFFYLGGFGFPNLSDLIIIIIAGAFWLVPVIFYFRALEHEESTRVVLVMQLLPVTTLIVAYPVLGESLTKNQWMAFILLILGSMLATLKKIESSWKLSKALLWVVLATLMWSASDVVFKKYEASFDDFESAFAYYSLGVFLMSVLLFLHSQKNKRHLLLHLKMSARGWWMMIASVLTAGIGSLSFAYALTLNKASLTSVIVGIQPLMVFGFGWLMSKWIKEVKKDKLDKQTLWLKGISFGVIMVGLVLLQGG